MSIETWGDMNKSQIDATLIETRITEMISEHNDDPTAHMADDQSIGIHRINDIIDHPAGSAVADKKTMTELSISDDFRMLDQWTIIGSVENGDWPQLALYVEYGAVNQSTISKVMASPIAFFSTAFNSLFQIMVRFDLSNNYYKSWFGFGFDSEVPVDGYGFIIVNGVLKACVAYGDNRVFSDTLTIDLSADHIYRAQLNAFEQKIYFYIDGSLVATLDTPVSSWNSDSGPVIGVKITQENDGNMCCSDLNFSRSIVNL
jgi:hypothetical protein